MAARHRASMCPPCHKPDIGGVCASCRWRPFRLPPCLQEEGNVADKAPHTMERIAQAMCRQLRLWAIAEVYSKASTACITTAKHSKAAIHLTMSSFVRVSASPGALSLSPPFPAAAGAWTQEAWERKLHAHS